MELGVDYEAISRLRRRLVGGAHLPIAAQYVWKWYCELSGSRSCGMGANPLAFGEIEAWMRLTGARPSPIDIRLIKSLDALWLSIQSEKKDESEVLRLADGTTDYEAMEDMIMALY